MIFDVSKPDDLANAIQELLCGQNLWLRFKEKGLARTSDFSWQRTAGLIWNTLHEL
jgi:glycosyltransferase involved in cell wall biosynthesis